MTGTIQTAIDVLPAAGGKVKLLDGTYNIATALVMDSYQTLEGCGRNTILTATTADLDIITATGGSGTEKIGIIIANLCIDGDAGSETNDDGIQWVYVDDSKIINVWSQDNGDYGISLTNCDNNLITGSSCSGNTDIGIYLVTCTYNTITNNNMANNGAGGIYIYDSSYNTIDLNTTNGDYEGIWLFECSHTTIQGNTCCNGGENGMWIEDSTDNTISGNTCSGNIEGIYLDGSSNNTVSVNTCYGNYRGIHFFNGTNNNASGNTCILNDEHGIWVEVTSDSSINGNVLTENSQTTTNTYDDIFIENNSDYNSIQGNVCRAGSQTPKPRYGINIGAATCNSNKVINNDLYDDGFGTAPYNDAGTGTIYVEPGIDDTAVNGETGQPISSNWAYDHENSMTEHNSMIWGITFGG